MGQKINLNTASQAELDRIPAIGEKCAQAIIEYRSKNGPFHSIADLDNIPGFGKKALEHLRENGTV